MMGGTRVREPGVADRLDTVRSRIADAAARAGRAPDDVTLVAVSKTFAPDDVLGAYRAGQRDFGESRAKELAAKAGAVAAADVRWHFVGRLQRNKVKQVVGVADLIHSIDREGLATAVAERAARTGAVQRVLLQVNVGADPAKAGVAPGDLEAAIELVRSLDGLRCEGLMTIPPFDADPRPLFARLREARDGLRRRFPEIRHLSMGMSRDYEIAIEEGATIVRVGEAVFGARPQPT